MRSGTCPLAVDYSFSVNLCDAIKCLNLCEGVGWAAVKFIKCFSATNFTSGVFIAFALVKMYYNNYYYYYTHQHYYFLCRPY